MLWCMYHAWLYSIARVLTDNIRVRRWMLAVIGLKNEVTARFIRQRWCADIIVRSW